MYRTFPIWCLPVLFLLPSCGEREDGGVRAYTIASLDQAIGGPKALARKGDLILENDHLRLGVLSARNSLGPGLHGGSIVDADLQRVEPYATPGYGGDQIAEVFPTVNMNVTAAGVEDPLTGVPVGGVRILRDGSKGGSAAIRVDGPAVPFLSLLNPLWEVVHAPKFWMETDYVVYEDRSWAELTTVVTVDAVGTGDPVDVTYSDDGMPVLDWAIESGLVLGDYYLSGGSLDVFAPGIGFDEDGAVYEMMTKGGNLFNAPFQLPFVAGIGEGVSYGMAPREGDLYVPLFTASQTVVVGGGEGGNAWGETGQERFESGEAFRYERYFFVGYGDVGSIVDQYVEARGIAYGSVRGHVVEAGTGEPLSGIDVLVFKEGEEAPFSQWETDVHPGDASKDGSFEGRLPVGTYELLVHDRSRARARRIPVDVKPGGQAELVLEVGRSGVVHFDVVDERGRSVPAKLTLFRVDGPPRRDPVLGDSFIGGSPEAVWFTIGGQGSFAMAPGEYQAVASRGLEYEIDVSDPFWLDDRTVVNLEFQVVRSVSTPGWISADLHVHGQASHDSGVSPQDRVRTMVAEGVEFFASTDHDYVVDHAPAVEELGMEQWVQTAVGTEISSVETGHLLGFPLEVDFLGEVGASDSRLVDWTGKAPGDVIGDLRQMGEAIGNRPFVFIGHPRDGIFGYFDQWGFDPFGGTPGFGGQPGLTKAVAPTLSRSNEVIQQYPISWDFDGIEVLNGKRLELLRTPTQVEIDDFGQGGDTDVYAMLTRTLEEQDSLRDGVYPLSADLNGHVDDWFALLNLGYRYTALGNSDTHGLTTTESGCPRNYIQSDTDDPAFIDDQVIADAVREHRVVASYGPFMEFTINGAEIGSELKSRGAELELEMRVQAPTWIPVDRVELYENGVLIEEWDVEATAGELRFDEVIVRQPVRDSWYVLMAMGEGDLSPVFTPIEVPYLDLQQVVEEALVDVEALALLMEPSAPVPRVFPIHPYALTNPIWVDVDGGGFDAPGHPEWWVNAEP